jgi:hypothetical protein
MLAFIGILHTLHNEVLNISGFQLLRTKAKGRAETLPLENLVEKKSIPPHLQLTEVSHHSFPLHLP